MNRKVLYACGVVAFLSVAAYVFAVSFGEVDSREEGERNGKVLRSNAMINEAPRTAQRTERKIGGQAALLRLRSRDVSGQLPAEAEGRVSSDEEISQLTNDILVQLQQTVDVRDFKGLQALVARLTSAPDSPFAKYGGCPVAVRKAIVNALASFGCGALPELVGFIGDTDPAVAQAATSAFQTSVSDFSLSDSERLPLLVAAAKIMTDGESLIGLMQNMTLLRNSLKVEAYLAIMESGTPQARDAAKAKMKFIFDGAACDTLEDVEMILQAYPDGARADLIYGGYKK